MMFCVVIVFSEYLNICCFNANAVLYAGTSTYKLLTITCCYCFHWLWLNICCFNAVNAVLYAGNINLQTVDEYGREDVLVSRDSVLKIAEQLCRLLQHEFIFVPVSRLINKYLGDSKCSHYEINSCRWTTVFSIFINDLWHKYSYL